MKAALFTEFGGPEVLHLAEVPDPVPGPGEVRVRVHAAGAQPADTAVRAGRSMAGLEVTLPAIPGNEFAGVIDRLGPGVEDWSLGQQVIGFRFLGGYAEYVTVDTARLAVKPAAMPWPEAGSLSASGQTAHVALAELRVGPGDTLLVHAAAGGVGTVAVQLALARGATVIGTAGERNHAYLRDLGAIPVTYGEGLADRVRAVAPGGVDAVLDGAGRGALDASVELVADRSRIGTIIDYPGAARLGTLALRGERTAARLTELLALWEAGTLRLEIAETFPLARAADAHRLVEDGHVRGKVVLLP